MDAILTYQIQNCGDVEAALFVSARRAFQFLKMEFVSAIPNVLINFFVNKILYSVYLVCQSYTLKNLNGYFDLTSHFKILRTTVLVIQLVFQSGQHA